MKQLKHNNTVKFIDELKSSTAYYIVMDYCSEGDLKGFIKRFNQQKSCRVINQNVLSEIDAKYVIREIVQGLHYLNVNLVMHRDIKLDNIMVNRKVDVQDCEEY